MKNPKSKAMSQKRIGVGDICRVRHNESGPGFPENTLVVIKECYPRFSEFPTRFKAATRTEWWYVEIGDITLYARNRNNLDF